MALKTLKGMSCDCWDSSKKDAWPESPFQRWTCFSCPDDLHRGEPSRFCGYSPPNLAEDIIIYHPIWEFNGLKTPSDNLKQDASNLFQFIPFHSAGYLVKNIEHVSHAGGRGMVERSIFFKGQLAKQFIFRWDFKTKPWKRNLNTFDALYMVHNWKWQIKYKSVLGPWTKQITGFQTATVKDCVQIGSNIFGRDMRGTGWLSTTLPTW